MKTKRNAGMNRRDFLKLAAGLTMTPLVEKSLSNKRPRNWTESSLPNIISWYWTHFQPGIYPSTGILEKQARISTGLQNARLFFTNTTLRQILQLQERHLYLPAPIHGSTGLTLSMELLKKRSLLRTYSDTFIKIITQRLSPRT